MVARHKLPRLGARRQEGRWHARGPSCWISGTQLSRFVACAPRWSPGRGLGRLCGRFGLQLRNDAIVPQEYMSGVTYVYAHARAPSRAQSPKGAQAERC
eukprot:363469-Chlamydomonas_euryale.AAC.7